MRRCLRFSVYAIFACAFLAMSAHSALAQRASGPVIYVLGGPTAVSQETVARLEQLTGGEVSRLSGNDRYATAAAVSRAHFTSAPTVLVASGESYADALSAGPAATALGGPILLVTRDGIPAATGAELDRLAPGRVVIAGGTSAVNRTVEAQLAAMGVIVERVSGPDRYATSAALSRVAAPDGARTVFLTSGRDFADAMSGAAPAAVHGATILLADPSSVTAPVRAELLRLAPREIVVLGGELAVPTRLADRLRAETGIPYRRVAGSDRFVTNAQVSRTFYPQGADVIFLANASRFADAMVVGAVARGGEAAAQAAPQAHEEGHDGVDGVLLYTHDVPPGGEPGDVQLPPMLEQEIERLAEEHREHRQPENEQPGETETPKPVETKTPAPPAAPPPPPNVPPSVDLNGADAGEDAVAAFTENGPPALVAPGTQVSDTDSTSLTGAKFTLNNRPDGAAEILGATAALPAGITAGVYDAATGILSLTGSATVADYQAAVRLIGYANSDDTPDLTARSITVTVSDAAGASTARTSVVSVTAANDPPTLDLNGAGTAGNDLTGVTFTEGGPAVPIAPAATVAEPEGQNLTGMTLTLSAAPDGAAESLAAPGIPASITAGAYDGPSRSLTLSGTASAADYQSALRAVTYANIAGNPNGADRVVSVTTTDGTAASIARTSTLSMSVVDDPPSLDLDGVAASNDATGAFTENGAAALIAPAAAITDADSTNLTGATITLTNRPDGAAELLAATAALPAGITAGAYNTTSGVLSLSGTATVANYQAALRLVGYSNSDDTPDVTARSITVTVSDAGGASTARTSVVSVAAANDAATLDLNGAAEGSDVTAGYTENGATALIASGALLTDPDSANLTGATITLTNRPDGGSEFLMATSALPGGISAVAYDNTTGVMGLTGSATVANYQAALRLIGYGNTDDSPDVTGRSITVTVTDGTATSPTRTSVVTVTPTNDAPTLDLNGSTAGTDVTATFNRGGSAVAIAPGAFAGDVDGVVTGATITIPAGDRADGNDETLDLPGTLAGITESWNLATGVLTLSGSATPETYQTALRAVTYHDADAAATAGARAVTVTLTDGTATTSARTSTVTVVTNSAPVAANHTYSNEPVFVNVLFVSGGGSPTAEAQTAHTLKLLDNATDAQNDTLTVTDLDVTTGQGTATILDAATGAFSYEPTTSGQHVLTYEISDGSLTDTGTVTIDVDTDKVVFVKSGAAGTGTSTSPAGTLTAAQAAAGAGDTIFVSVGNGTAYTGGIALESGQRLIGRPSGLTLSYSGGSVTVVAAGNSAKPVIGNTAGGAITMADGATVDGIAVTQTTQPGITGGAGTATIRNVAVTTTTANGIDLATGTYTLGGGATVSTGTGTALRLTSGTISVSGAGNTLSASGGPALNLAGTAETEGMVFESVSTNGGVNGIIFSPANGNDPDASLTVQGVSGATSGGTLQNHSGDAIVATAGSVTLNKMLIQANTGRAISATGTSGLALHTVEATGNGDLANEHSVQLTNITGTNSFNTVTFQEGSGDLLRLSNTNKNATLTILNSIFQDTNATGGAGGVAIYGDGTSAITASITGSTFTQFNGAGVLFATGTLAGGNGSSTLTFKDNTLNGSAGRPTHLEILPEGQTTVTATVGGPGASDGNTFDTVAEAGVAAVHVWADGTAQLRGTIQGNTIDDSQGYGIWVLTWGGNPTRLLVRDNTISDPYAEGIWVGNSDSPFGNALDATILNNVVSQAGDLGEPEPVVSIRFEAFDDVVCSDIAGNNVAVPENTSFDITLDTQGATTHTYVMTDDAPVTDAKVSARNGNASVSLLTVAPTKHGSGACLQP